MGLDPGLTDSINVVVADDVGSQVALRIDAVLLFEEVQPGFPEIEDGCFLIRGQATLDIDEGDQDRALGKSGPAPRWYLRGP